MQSFWNLTLRVVLVFSGYMSTVGAIGLVKCGFPRPAVIAVLLIGYIGFQALRALNKDKSSDAFPPKGEIEQALLVCSVVIGSIAGLTMKFC